MPPRASQFNLRKSRKASFEVRVGDDAQLITKKSGETLQHVLVKALIWALYHEDYPGIEIERDIGDEKLPDCVALAGQEPLFWGESGRMSSAKAVDIATRFPATHFVNVRWAVDLDDFTTPLLRALRAADVTRSAPFEFAVVTKNPLDFVDESGHIRISREDLIWTRL